MIVRVEMFRGDAWKDVGTYPTAQVSVDGNGAITITVKGGHIHPPWRVSIDENVVFERAA